MTTLSTEVNEYLDYIVQTVKATMPVSAIWLFGSYAKGNYDRYSDLDLFVVTPDKSKRQLDWMHLLYQAIRCRRDRPPYEIVVNYNDSFDERSKWLNTLEREVIDTGVKLYESRC